MNYGVVGTGYWGKITSGSPRSCATRAASTTSSSCDVDEDRVSEMAEDLRRRLRHRRRGSGCRRRDGRDAFNYPRRHRDGPALAGHRPARREALALDSDAAWAIVDAGRAQRPLTRRRAHLPLPPPRCANLNAASTGESSAGSSTSTPVGTPSASRGLRRACSTRWRSTTSTRTTTCSTASRSRSTARWTTSSVRASTRRQR